LLEKDYLDKIGFKYGSSLYVSLNESGSQISKALADEIIDINNEEFNAKLQQLLERSKLPKKGKVKSTLLFTTGENIHFPIVLKIVHNRKEVYILGNYFGRCDREASLDVWPTLY